MAASITEYSAPKDAPLACKVAVTYLDYVRTQNVEGLRNLFAEGVDYTGPDGVATSDLDKIGAKYAHGFKNMGTPWRFRMANALPFGEDGCLFEFAVAQAGEDFALTAVDRIRVNSEGKITQFLPYFASPRLKMVVGNIEK